MDDDDSIAKSDQRSEDRYLIDEDRSTSALECSILSEFGWTTNYIHRDSFSNDFAAEPISKSETSGLSLSSANMQRLQPVVEQPSTSNNNPSVSSSSSDQDPAEKSTGSDERTPPLSAPISSKKKGQKRVRQQRFAFVTKSEVDHLEDGYRWRKYGQKAVKNSPYPRSYYRCTNTRCTVKKRVERSCEDPTTVITTYEGQHCHQNAGFPRGGGLSIREAAFGVQMGPPNSQFYYPTMHLPQQSPQGSISPTPQPTLSVLSDALEVNRMIMSTDPLMPSAASTPQFPSDEGLLGDIVSPRPRNNFHP